MSQWATYYDSAENYGDSPISLISTVVHGFKRGSKELGIPTANLDMDQLGDVKDKLSTGIYYGLAKLSESSVLHQCVVSIGWNPFYKNEKRTIEVHLLAQMDDFYGENLHVLLCGFLRNECNFNSVDDLISCINEDISRAKVQLSDSQNKCNVFVNNYSIWPK